jgi:hypothetical protein
MTRQPNNVFLYQPQGGAASMPVFTVNNSQYHNYVRGPVGTYDPGMKQFSQLVTPELDAQVRHCYMATGNPQKCLRDASRAVYAASRGHVNRDNVSYSTGRFVGSNWHSNPPCRCNRPTGMIKVQCNCGN